MSAVGFYWDFGDGTTSVEENPSHVYKMAGIYTVMLIITDTVCGQLTYYFTIRVYDYDYLGDGINLSKTNKCLRFAIPQNKQQGEGWAIYDDIYEGERTYNFPYPEGLIGTCEIIDERNVRRYLAMDSNTFRVFELGVVDEWQDGRGDYAGVEIESEITLREHEAPIGLPAKIKHGQTHLDIKPWYKDQRSTGEFDANGYRSGHHADLYLKQGSSPNIAMETKQVPVNGQLIFDRLTTSDALQFGTKIRVAPWRLVKVTNWMKQLDKGAPPLKKTMSEMDWADEYREPVFWVSRNQDGSPMQDRATGETGTGTYTATVDGPDLLSGSALGMGAGDFLRYSSASRSFAGDCSFTGWLRTTGNVTLFSTATGSLSIRVVEAGGVFSLIFTDSANSVTIPLNSDFSSWTMVTVVKRLSNVAVYENGQLTNTAALNDPSVRYGGQLTALNGQCSGFDLRILSRALTANAVLYVYDDITEHNGNTVCPVY